MTWNPVWEDIYRSREWGRYPPEELVRFLARTYSMEPARQSVRVLDLGCGPGSGASWLVAREGFGLCGIDGSPTAIAKAHARLSAEGLAGDFRVGDIAELPWPADFFDLVLDNGCLTCNAEREAAIAIGEIHRVLKARGRHFSITPRAGCWGDGEGERVDATTTRAITAGPFAGLGSTRFPTLDSVTQLYSAFHDLEVEYSARSELSRTKEISHWIVSCRK